MPQRYSVSGVEMKSIDFKILSEFGLGIFFKKTNFNFFQHRTFHALQAVARYRKGDKGVLLAKRAPLSPLHPPKPPARGTACGKVADLHFLARFQRSKNARKFIAVRFCLNFPKFQGFFIKKSLNLNPNFAQNLNTNSHPKTRIYRVVDCFEFATQILAMTKFIPNSTQNLNLTPNLAQNFNRHSPKASL